MKMMRLSEMNKYVAERCGMGVPHNTDIKTRNILEQVGHEVKHNPPKILAKTARKFGKARAQKQRKAILLNKARKAGARIPKK